MATLPSNSRMAAGNGIITPENPLNSPGVSNNQGYNTFDLSRQNCITQRFAEITPYDVQECEIGDRFSLKLSTESRSYTFKSPIMSNVRINKDYFFVPYSCMFPNTYEQLFVNPVKGNDVPDDAYGYFDLGRLLNYCIDIIGQSPGGAKKTPYFKFIPMSLLWHTLQYGGLLDNLGYRTQLMLRYSESSGAVETFSDAFNAFFATLQTNKRKIRVKPAVEGDFAPFSIDYNGTFTQKESRIFWYKLFNIDKPFYFDADNSNIENGDFSSFSLYMSVFKNYFLAMQPVNIRRLLAYQMTCAQFYSNDAVDSVFTAKLWLQNMESIAHAIGGGAYPDWFDYNGINLQYDLFSNHVTSNLIRIAFSPSSSAFNNYDFTDSTLWSSPTSKSVYYRFFFFNNLFTYQNALVYGDYFSGARTQPLAVGDVEISVQDSSVSAIDVTRNLMMQRFLNAVNRVGQLVADYARNVFGFAPKNLPPQPRFIVHRANTLMGNEVVNTTSDDQGNLVTNLRSNSSKYMYDVFIDEQGVLIGLSSITCALMYATNTWRNIFHKTRLDDFQPFLQNIGDQDVRLQELVSASTGVYPTGIFGYQMQDAEYKYAVSEIHGGFARTLRSWVFARRFPVQDYQNLKISSDFIRFKPYEFDDFYESLNGHTLEDYFHIITSFNLGTMSNRKMMYRPGIL